MWFVFKETQFHPKRDAGPMSPPPNVSQGFVGYGEPIGSQSPSKNDQQFGNQSQYNVTY